jgi:hypothetical protein
MKRLLFLVLLVAAVTGLSGCAIYVDPLPPYGGVIIQPPHRHPPHRNPYPYPDHCRYRHCR